MSSLDKITGINVKTDTEIIANFEQDMADYQEALHDVMLPESEEPELDKKPDELDKNIRAMVELVVDNNGQLHIYIKWNAMDDITAQTIGKLLHNMNTGSFDQGCANILLGIAQQQQGTKLFIKNCFASLKGHQDTEPVIKPSEVFGMSSGSQQG